MHWEKCNVNPNKEGSKMDFTKQFIIFNTNHFFYLPGKQVKIAMTNKQNINSVVASIIGPSLILSPGVRKSMSSDHPLTNNVKIKAKNDTTITTKTKLVAK
jgi:hypothetical protein